MQPAIEQALGRLNAALKSVGAPFKVTEGGRKGKALDFAKGDALQEWAVPFDFPADWKPAAREAFDAFHAARQAIPRKLADSFAAHADPETLYNQPAMQKDHQRSTGPITLAAHPYTHPLTLDKAAPQHETKDKR